MSAIIDAYDAVFFDLDGVVYLGTQPVKHAAEAIEKLNKLDIKLCYVTNNAFRSPQQVVEHLKDAGQVEASLDQVLTSAQASIDYLKRTYSMDSTVYVLGSDELRKQVEQAGFKTVTAAHDKPDLLIQGLNPQISGQDLWQACEILENGATWIACNTDLTMPTDTGFKPGNGAFVQMLTTVTKRQPDVVIGKPQPWMFIAAAQRLAAKKPLIIGDRLDTDIEGAGRAGFDSALVLTGAHQESDIDTSQPDAVPTYVLNDLRDLFSK